MENRGHSTNPTPGGAIHIGVYVKCWPLEESLLRGDGIGSSAQGAGPLAPIL